MAGAHHRGRPQDRLAQFAEALLRQQIVAPRFVIRQDGADLSLH